MDWCNGFAERIHRDEPLANCTWYRLGGSARYFFSPANLAELCAVLRSARQANIPVRILGAGANLLVRDRGFDGLVIRLDEPEFCSVVYLGTRVAAGAGADLMQLSRDCSYRGLSGMECLAGIPGTVGGAVTMNAGGRFGQIADVIERVTLLERDGTLRELSRDEMGFGYRKSAVGDRIVIQAVFELHAAPVEVTRERFQEIWRYKKESQPLAAHSAGCVFRNPPGDSAGRLIDQAGLKGAARGRARVSEMHGNFIVADEGATAEDVLALVEQVRAKVREHSGIDLELEIDVW